MSMKTSNRIMKIITNSGTEFQWVKIHQEIKRVITEFNWDCAYGLLGPGALLEIKCWAGSPGTVYLEVACHCKKMFFLASRRAQLMTALCRKTKLPALPLKWCPLTDAILQGVYKLTSSHEEPPSYSYG